MVSVVSNRFKKAAMEAYFDGKTVRAVLVKSTYTPSPAHNLWSQASAHESVDSLGTYIAGGSELEGLVFVQDDVLNRGRFSFDAPSWDPVTIPDARYLMVIAGTGGTLADYEIVATHDLGITQDPANGPFEWTPNAAGAIYLQASA